MPSNRTPSRRPGCGPISATDPVGTVRSGESKQGEFGMAEVQDSQENYEECLKNQCGTCPSYPECGEEALYCARGGSEATIERNGCDCPECPIWQAAGLTSMYYCAR